MKRITSGMKGNQDSDIKRIEEIVLEIERDQTDLEVGMSSKEDEKNTEKHKHELEKELSKILMPKKKRNEEMLRRIKTIRHTPSIKKEFVDDYFLNTFEELLNKDLAS